VKKKIFGIIGALLALIVITGIGLVVFYNASLSAVGDEKDKVTIVIENGTSSRGVVDKLYEADLVKNKYCGYIYLKLNKELMLQAGTYELDRGMSFQEIMEKINNGEALENSVDVTFIEGKRLVNYVKVISDNFPYTEDEILAKLSDKVYLQELIDDYWFLTDEILNDNLYYALEGYLYPDTYRFNKESTIDTIVRKMLNETDKVLSEYKTVTKNDYTIHEILTMASIVELEGSNSNDRAGVAGVFFNRLEGGWSLGSDVTTYYAARVEMSERDLWQYEIDEVNHYNTRPAAMAGKLPVGPICSPSKDSISATMKPTKHDYYFFVADKNGKTYFTKTNAEHNATIADLKNQGLWYVYE
jgi:UPF0755 protein